MDSVEICNFVDETIQSIVKTRKWSDGRISILNYGKSSEDKINNKLTVVIDFEKTYFTKYCEEYRKILINDLVQIYYFLDTKVFEVIIFYLQPMLKEIKTTYNTIEIVANFYNKTYLDNTFSRLIIHHTNL